MSRAPIDPTPTDWGDKAMRRRITRRYAAERRFRLLGLAAVSVSVGFLAFLLINMIGNGFGGFIETRLRLNMDFPHSTLILDPAALRGADAETALAAADIEGAVAAAAEAQYGPGGAGLISEAAWLRVRNAILADPDMLSGTRLFHLPVSGDVDRAAKGEGDPKIGASYRRLSE